jgi:hypothetical protein
MSPAASTTGSATFWTVPVAAELALACPAALEAVTRTRTVAPTSALVSV